MKYSVLFNFIKYYLKGERDPVADIKISDGYDVWDNWQLEMGEKEYLESLKQKDGCNAANWKPGDHIPDNWADF